MPNGSRAQLEAELAQARQDVRLLRRILVRLLRGSYTLAELEAYLALEALVRPVSPGEHKDSPDPLFTGKQALAGLGERL